MPRDDNAPAPFRMLEHLVSLAAHADPALTLKPSDYLAPVGLEGHAPI
jgi:hypothetical protein